MKRLDAFDVLLTDWMLGFSILLLVAIKFAPGIVGQQLTPRLSVLPKLFVLEQNEGKTSIKVEDCKECNLKGKDCSECLNVVEFCPLDGHLLEGSHWCPQCKHKYPMVLVSDWRQHILYILLMLFVVKYIHERSVLRFHLYEDDRYGKFQEKIHKVELKILHDRSNRWMLHISTFASRLLFLLFFYLFVITLYITNLGVLKGNESQTYYGLLLVFGYVIPDFCLFIATKGEVFRIVKEGYTLKRAFYISCAILIILIFYIILLTQVQMDPLTGLLIFVVVAAIICAIATARVFRKFDQCSIEVTAFKWLLLDVFNIIAIAAYAIFSHSHDVDITWIACAVLAVNLFDWVSSSSFYFGTDKFTIQGKRKTKTWRWARMFQARPRPSE